MYRTVPGLGLLAALLWSLVSVAADPPKPDPKKDPITIPPPKDGADLLKKGDKPDARAATKKLVAAGTFTGKLLDYEVTGADRKLTAQHAYRYAVLNPEPYARLLEIQADYVTAVRNGDTDGVAEALRAAAAEGPELYKELYRYEEKTYNFVLEVVAETRVRTMLLPPVFDEKGNPRKYTAQELKKLKGPGNLPGYPAALKDLKVGQSLRFDFSRKKAEPSVIINPLAPTLTAVTVTILAEPELKAVDPDN